MSTHLITWPIQVSGEAIDVMATVKDQIEAKIVAFHHTGLPCKPSTSVCRYYGFLHGRDFKIFAQVCLFVLWDHLTDQKQMSGFPSLRYMYSTMMFLSAVMSITFTRASLQALYILQCRYLPIGSIIT